MGKRRIPLYSPKLFNSYRIALFCVILYSLRSKDGVNCEHSERTGLVIRRGRGSPQPTAPSGPTTASGNAGVWRRRSFPSRTPSTTPATLPPDPKRLLPDDFINLVSNSAGGYSSESGVLPLESAFITTTGPTRKIIADPFRLVGDDNILGPTPSQPRRKIIRRTRRRRIKKVRGDSTQDPQSATTEEEVTGEEFGSTTSASVESVNKFKYLTTAGSSTVKPTFRTSSSSTTMKLAVVPFDSMMQGQTEEITLEESSSQPTTGPSGGAPNNIKPGFYVRNPGRRKHNGRKRAKSKENLWKVDPPNLSVDLFDNQDDTEELNHTNLDKRESSGKERSRTPHYDMFSMKPTAFAGIFTEGDMRTDESITNTFVNTTIPISTELQNSLQFTLQNYHPLLNSDTVLTQKEFKVPENKTIAITHSLAESPVDTPVAPDLRFLPAHLRKSHPLLSQETFLGGEFGGLSGSGSRVGPRLNVHNNHGIHSMRNRPSSTTSTSTTTTTDRTNKVRSSTTINPVYRATSPTTRFTTTTSTQPTTTSRRTIPTTASTPPSTTKLYPSSTTPKNVHLEALGNLKITEIVYPTNAGPPLKGTNIVDMKGYVPPPRRPSSSSSTDATVSTSHAPTSTVGTSTKATTTTSSSTTPRRPSTERIPSTTSRVPTPIIDTTDHRSPPLILMGSDSNIGSAIESPPAFDDLLLEELVRGFEPPKPSTTSTTTTTTTSTTRRPTTTTTRKTTTTTTTTPPPPPPSTSSILSGLPQDEDTQQLLQLLNLLQPSTTTTIKSTSTTNPSSSTNKAEDEFLKQVAFLENLLSPTAKTMMKEAVDKGSTAKIKSSATAGAQQGLSESDIQKIMMLMASSTTTTTTTTPRPVPTAPTISPALQNLLNMFANPSQQSLQKPVFSIPEPPKPVPTTSSFDILSSLLNLNGQQPATPKPAINGFGGLGGALSGIFDSFLPKKTQSHREAAMSGSNPLLSFFQPPSEPVPTPAPGPYYWFDVNAFLGQDPSAGPMSGIRPKFGTRDYFIKVRKRRNSMEHY